VSTLTKLPFISDCVCPSYLIVFAHFVPNGLITLDEMAEVAVEDSSAGGANQATQHAMGQTSAVAGRYPIRLCKLHIIELLLIWQGANIMCLIRKIGLPRSQSLRSRVHSLMAVKLRGLLILVIHWEPKLKYLNRNQSRSSMKRRIQTQLTPVLHIWFLSYGERRGSIQLMYFESSSYHKVERPTWTFHCVGWVPYRL
jgi:hypothetical protein